VGFAVGVVRGGRLESFGGHGLADIGSGERIDEHTVFRIASITKTLTAIAVMQLWAQGLVDLDAPVSEYLTTFRLIPAKETFRPATLRHLLTHTAGVPELLRASDLLRPDWGDSLALDEPMPTLAVHYRDGIPLHTEPGTTFAYTNHGFATLQQVVEDVSGLPFDRYLRTRVFEPLGMADTDLLRDERFTSRLATGYSLGRRGPQPVTDRAWVTAGASSVYSTTHDMALYIAALTGGGSNEHGSILRRETLAMMFAPQFQPHPLVPGMGLGFDRLDAGGHLVIGHGGILPGFNSQLFVAPDDGVGVIAWTNGANGAMLWLPTELARLLNQLLEVPEPSIRTDIPQRPETWSGLIGRYQARGRLTDIRARLMTGFGADVFVRGDQLMLRLLTPIPALLRGLALHPDDEADPYVFRIDLAAFGLPNARIVFSHGEREASAMHLDIFPMSLHRRHPARGPKPWQVAAGIAAASSAATLGVRLAARARRRAGA
jgi:CubicO group peptidase (beta-lactamase class C family)